MSGEEVFFGPYREPDLRAILDPHLEAAFRDGALDESVVEVGVREAANRWGDARKALRLFRHAGETANERGLQKVTRECIDVNLETTERAAILEKLASIPLNHLLVLSAAVARRTGQGQIRQPVTTTEIYETLRRADEDGLGERAIRDVVRDLETMGLVETWIDSRGRDGRVKQIETAFDPEWIRDAQAERAADLAVEPDSDE